MAFTVTHTAEFTDRLGTDWKVDILKDVAQGAITTLQVTGDPLHIEWLAPSDDLLTNPVKGSTATLNLECVTNFQYIGFYNSEEMVYKMKVYKATVLYWQGWLSTDYTEPYDPVPYTVALTAADGLGMLRDIEYKNAGVYYPDRDEEDDILLNILGKIGYTQFTEFCNIYEDRMSDAAGDSPFTQVLADNDNFKDLDCYSTLEAICKHYHAIIRQWAGEMVIYRPTELVDDTVLGRIITSGAVTATSLSPDQFLPRTGVASNIVDVLGGILMYQQPISKFTGVQDYGYKESWVDNHKFDPDSFDPATNTFEEWTTYALDNFHPLQYRTGEPEGLFINPGTGEYIYQIFGAYSRISPTDVFRFEFDYKFINATGADVTPATFLIGLTCGNTPQYYAKHPASDDGTKAEWTTVNSTLSMTEATAAKGEGQWKTWTRLIVGLSGDYPMNVIFYSHATLNLCINNIRFTATSDKIVSLKKKVKRSKWLSLIPIYNFYYFFNSTKTIRTQKFIDNEEIVEHSYTATNAITAPEITDSYILGDVTDTGIDNVLEQFKGSLCVSVTGSLIQTATDFVTSFASHYLALVTPSVVLTSSGSTLYFEATSADDFDGASSIVNATGTLTGTVTTLVAASAGTLQIDTVTVTGNSGRAQITCLGMHRYVDWDTSLDITCAAFVANFATDFPGITVTQGVGAGHEDELIFTEDDPMGGFVSPTIANVSGTLGGSVAHTQVAAGETHRKDQIVLSGSSGTASVTVHANAETCTYNTTAILDYTSSWHTGNHPGHGEALRVLQIVANERALLYSKGRQFLQLSLEEDIAAAGFNMIGNLQDPLNVTGANLKVFVANRGSIDVRNRTWTVDLMEIGDK
jgi:hypothetical protein